MVDEKFASRSFDTISIALRFIKITSEEPVVDYLADTIAGRLRTGTSVLWLVSGGSAGAVAAGASKRLAGGEDLAKLTVMLADERYGPIGHQDSNWLQLGEAGFGLENAKLVPVLTVANFEITVKEFSDRLQKELAASDYAIGLFGIGADGHTAGILPGSPALNTEKFAGGYSAEDYQRITMTPKAIGKLDEAVAYAVGENKREALDLLEKDLSPAKQPAQLLKQVPRLRIFNDYKP